MILKVEYSVLKEREKTLKEIYPKETQRYKLYYNQTEEGFEIFLHDASFIVLMAEFDYDQIFMEARQEIDIIDEEQEIERWIMENLKDAVKTKGILSEDFPEKIDE